VYVDGVGVGMGGGGRNHPPPLSPFFLGGGGGGVLVTTSCYCGIWRTFMNHQKALILKGNWHIELDNFT